MKNGSQILLLICFAVHSIGASAATKTLTVGVALRLNDAYNNTVKSLMNGIETAKAEFEKEHTGTKIQLKIFPMERIYPP